MINFMNDSIKSYVGYALILMLLVFSYAAVSYVSTYSKSVEPSSFRSFTVSGEGKAVAIPDIAMFTYSVVTEGGKDLSALQKQNVEAANAVNAFVKSKGVEDEDIKTEGYNIYPRYQSFSCPPVIYGQGVSYPERDIAVSPRPCPPSEIVGYTITQTVSVKVRDFSTTGEILAGVVEGGANNVSGLSFTVDDPTTVETEAREEAIAKARAKAEGIADAGDFRIGRLLNISEGGYIPFYEKYGRGGAVALDGSGETIAPSIEPGSEEVRITVTLTYEIK